MDKDIDPMSLRLNTILSFAQRFKNDDKMISVLVNLKKSRIWLCRKESSATTRFLSAIIDLHCAILGLAKTGEKETRTD